MRRLDLLKNAAALLHNAHITKCRNRCYKTRNLLQNASLLQNAAKQGQFTNKEKAQQWRAQFPQLLLIST